MIQRILIAEDHKSSNSWIRQFAKDLGIEFIQPAYYCDDALLALRKGIENKEPYELLITDLSFAEDHREQNLAGGPALIAAAKKLQPDLKILVFSGEQQPEVVTHLFQKLEIDGYVCKGRDDEEQLRGAIENLSKQKRYIPVAFRQAVRSKNNFDLNEFDLMILSLLAGGKQQKEMPQILKQQRMKPTSLSSIEKRLNQIRTEFGFSTNEQLIAYCIAKKIV